jgi:hypothetical protein
MRSPFCLPFPGKTSVFHGIYPEQGWKVVIQKDAKFQQIGGQALDEPTRDGQSIKTLVDALNVE